MKRMKAGLAAASAVAAVVAGIAAAVPASATTVQSNCVTNSMCLYYNSTPYGLGAEFGSLHDIWSFNPAYSGGYQYYFKTGPHGSAGNNVNVWNHAAAARDYFPGSWFWVYYDTGYSCAGPSDYILPGAYVNLTSVKNENASISSDPCN